MADRSDELDDEPSAGVITLNVAVLVYARTAGRHGEIAMRYALGASRGRIVAQLFVEVLVVSLCGAAAGLVLAQIGVGLGNRIMALEQDFGNPFWMDYSLRPATILFAVVLALVTAVITGVLTALQATGRRLHIDLCELGAAKMRLGRMWTVLIVVQVMIAVAALPAAINMGWTTMRDASTRSRYPAKEFVAATTYRRPHPRPHQMKRQFHSAIA